MPRSCSVDTLDVTFSKLVRERNDWTCEYSGCEYCGNHSFRHRPGGLHNSHFRGRRGRSTRWDLDNCFALCHKRHERMGDSPDEHAAWVRRQLGDVRFDELVRRANTPRKVTPLDRLEMNAHFRAELERIANLRAMGLVGYVEATSYD